MTARDGMFSRRFQPFCHGRKGEHGTVLVFRFQASDQTVANENLRADDNDCRLVSTRDGRTFYVVSLRRLIRTLTPAPREKACRRRPRRDVLTRRHVLTSQSFSSSTVNRLSCFSHRPGLLLSTRFVTRRESQTTELALGLFSRYLRYLLTCDKCQFPRPTNRCVAEDSHASQSARGSALLFDEQLIGKFWDKTFERGWSYFDKAPRREIILNVAVE